MEALRLEKKIPPSLRGGFWSYLIDAVDVEIQNFRALIEEKLGLFIIEDMTYEDMIRTSKQLGVLFSVTVYGPTLDNALVSSADPTFLAFLRREVEAIPFKIANKATVPLYESFYKSLSRDGQVFIYYYKSSSGGIVRSANNPLTNLVGSINPRLPYRYDSDQNYSGEVSNELQLDSGLDLDTLSSGKYWTLDTITLQTSTCHIGIEMIIDRLVTKITSDPSGGPISTTFLLTNGFFDFIQKNFNFTRRVTEVPHVGAQLSILMDTSHKIDTVLVPRTYTVPTLNLNALTTPAFDTLLATYSDNNAALQLYKVGFGVGTYALPSQASPAVPLPTALKEHVASSYILFDEKYENSDWVSVSGQYQGQEINDFLLHDVNGYQLGNAGSGAVNGVNHAFTGTLLFTPIKKGQLSFYFTHSALQYEITDDGKGNLIITDPNGNSGVVGSISYAAGTYDFDTTFLFTESMTIATSVDPLNPLNLGGTTYVDGNLTIDTGSSVAQGSAWISYQIGSRLYVLHDNGSGGFVTSDGLNPHFTGGSINYLTGAVVLNFDTPLDYNETTGTGTMVTARYSFIRTLTPDNNTKITVNYYFTYTSISITEAGLFDVNNNLIAYMTFPAIEFLSADFHLNVHFFLKKTAFTS
jgi:hypothetical protein